MTDSISYNKYIILFDTVKQDTLRLCFKPLKKTIPTFSKQIQNLGGAQMINELAGQTSETVCFSPYA